MKAGDICIHKVMQPDDSHKIRPVLLLKAMPFPGDWLVCAISTQLRQEVIGFDEVLQDKDAAFAESGLKSSSVFRLGFLNTVNQKVLPGKIGFLGESMVEALQKKDTSRKYFAENFIDSEVWARRFRQNDLSEYNVSETEVKRLIDDIIEKYMQQ